MNYPSKTVLRLVSVFVFAVSLVTAGIIRYTSNHADAAPATTGFTMVQNKVFVPASGEKPILYGVSKRYQKADGTAKEITTYYGQDGSPEREDVQFREPGRGLFRVDERNKVLNLISSLSAISSAQKLQRVRADRNFNREEYVLGQKTLVVRMPGARTDEYRETYYAPLLNTHIKILAKKKDGVDVTEAKEILLGEPEQRHFESISAYPLVYDHFNWKIDHAEKTGKVTAADGLRRQLLHFEEQERRNSR